jgi:anti-anti-sigma factor
VSDITAPSLDQLRPGDHICLIVDDSVPPLAQAAEVMAAAGHHRQKTIVFGPPTSQLRTSGDMQVALVADPWTDFLSEQFDPDVMYEMFRDQTAVARAEGYDGLRLMADMDWLLPARRTTSELVAFEVMLDSVVYELDATVVCAYRRSTFADSVGALTCVHPINVGNGPDPEFQLVVYKADSWRLSGEVDLAVAEIFASAITTAVRNNACRLDVSGLDFIDVAGTRELAHALAASNQRLEIVGNCPTLRRCWDLSGFQRIAPSVAFVP